MREKERGGGSLGGGEGRGGGGGGGGERLQDQCRSNVTELLHDQKLFGLNRIHQNSADLLQNGSSDVWTEHIQSCQICPPI